MRLRTITVRVTRTVVLEFKKAAREAFPCETFAYLLGRDAGTLVEVEELFFPMDVDEWCTENGVHISPGWLPAAKKEAAHSGLKVVGDIHSHPFKHWELGSVLPECAPSEQDLDGGQHHITGICRVREFRGGRKVASIRFWGPMFPVVEEIH